MPVKRTGKYTFEWLLRVAVPYRGDDCLPWPFARTRGRGATWVPGSGRRGGWRAAHVVACEAVHGPRPTPQHEVAHSCGRGHEGCVAPKHLRWGTPAGNQRDRRAHGTHLEGEAVKHKAKLTESDARYVLQSDLRGVELATYFGVSPAAISYIRTRKNWKHIA